MIGSPMRHSKKKQTQVERKQLIGKRPVSTEKPKNTHGKKEC
jgi:hypothetical protein